MGYNHIEKLDFLADYPRARSEAFLLYIINSSFAATGIVPIDANRVLSKLNISLKTPTPLGSRPSSSSSKSSQFTPKTPRTMIQLEKQASLLKGLLNQRSNSPPSPSKTAIDQIIKGAYLSICSAALLAKENANLRQANEKIRQKRARTHRQIPHKGGLLVAEGRQLAQQLNTPTEAEQPVSHT